MSHTSETDTILHPETTSVIFIVENTELDCVMGKGTLPVHDAESLECAEASFANWMNLTDNRWSARVQVAAIRDTGCDMWVIEHGCAKTVDHIDL